MLLKVISPSTARSVYIIHVRVYTRKEKYQQLYICIPSIHQHGAACTQNAMAEALRVTLMNHLGLALQIHTHTHTHTTPS